MPLPSMRKKTTLATTTNTSNTVSRPSLIETMLLTSTPLRRSADIQTRSATNLTHQQIFKEKNQTYEDMHLLNLTKSLNKKEKRKEKKTPLSQNSMNKSLKKRSKIRKTVIVEQENDDDDDSTENEQEIQIRKKPTPKKRKTTLSKQTLIEEPIVKKLRQANVTNKKRVTKMPIAKTSAGSSDTCTTVDEENEETRLIQQSKLYIEGPGIRTNYKKIAEHNDRIGERIQTLRSHQQIPTNLPSPILSRSTHATQDPVKIKTASRITFALPPRQSVSPVPIHPPSPQMPPTTTAASIDTQTELFPNTVTQEQHCQTLFIDTQNQSIQTESTNQQSISTGVQYDVEHIPQQQHLLCKDLTVCTCVEQLVKTRQFLADTTNQLQSTVVRLLLN